MNNKIKRLFILKVLATSIVFAQDAPTIVEITDKVLLDKCKPFGVNIGGDSSWEAKEKTRCAINFEGTAYRRVIHAHETSTADTIDTFMVNDGWKEILTKGGLGTFTILSGAAKGTKGKILSIEPVGMAVRWAPNKKEPLYQIKIDQQLQGLVKDDGVLVEALRFADGQIHYGGEAFYNKKSEANFTISHDVPPGSFGQCALKIANDKYILRSGKVPAGVAQATLSGSFWAKAATPGAGISVACRKKPVGAFELSGEWKKYDFTTPIEPSESGEGENEVWVDFVASGEVLVDDLLTEMGGDPNPTPYYGEFVQTLKDMNAGIVRYLQMGGSDVDNFMNPRLSQHSYTHKMTAKMGPHEGHDTHDYSVVDFYTLCEQLGIEPWLNLPGTISAEQVARFMEFLGAPADVGLGKLRAEQGHPKPFTETLKGIHIEFGNEIWNFMDSYYGCGYNGPDFWQGLIAAGKSSPYYKPNLIFHVGGRGFPGMKAVPDYVPNADRFTWAPYLMHGFSKEQEAQLASEENFLRWAFSYSINCAVGKGEMAQALKQAKGIAPLSVYEVSHHIFMFGDPATMASFRARNTIQASLGGAMNVLNAMLMNLRYAGAFDQCFFTHGLATKGKVFDFDKDAFNPWSTHATVNGSGEWIPQPKMLALATVNQVIKKELLETVQSGGKPVFGGFEYNKLTPVPDLDALWSYAFRDGKQRSLILVSLDLEKARTVQIQFAGKPKAGATTYLVSGPSFKANNVGPSPEVTVTESKLKGFSSGVTVEVPPSSMLALVWEVE